MASITITSIPVTISSPVVLRAVMSVQTYRVGNPWVMEAWSSSLGAYVTWRSPSIDPTGRYSQRTLSDLSRIAVRVEGD